MLKTAKELGLSRYLVKLDKATGTARLCRVQAVEVVDECDAGDDDGYFSLMRACARLNSAEMGSHSLSPIG